VVQGKWLVTLQGLASSGRGWDEQLSSTLLEDPSLGEVDALRDLTSDVCWQGSLEKHSGIFRLQACWQGRMKRHCSRCNVAFDWKMQGQFERNYQIGQPPDIDVSGQECEYLTAPGNIYLLDVLREDIWLAWRADVICRESCKGLCSYCGCDQNKTACQCEQKNSDHPFAALAALKLDA